MNMQFAGTATGVSVDRAYPAYTTLCWVGHGVLPLSGFRRATPLVASEDLRVPVSAACRCAVTRTPPPPSIQHSLLWKSYRSYRGRLSFAHLLLRLHQQLRRLVSVHVAVVPSLQRTPLHLQVNLQHHATRHDAQALPTP